VVELADAVLGCVDAAGDRRMLGVLFTVLIRRPLFA
jgi:hypothetical protein